MILSKTEFCKVIDRIREAWDFDMAIYQNDITKKYGAEISLDTSFLAEPLVTTLEKMFNVTDESIYYFCFELNFGRDGEPINPNEVDYFSTAEKLYDYLINRDGEQLSDTTGK